MLKDGLNADDVSIERVVGPCGGSVRLHLSFDMERGDADSIAKVVSRIANSKAIKVNTDKEEAYNRGKAHMKKKIKDAMFKTATGLE